MMVRGWITKLVKSFQVIVGHFHDFVVDVCILSMLWVERFWLQTMEEGCVYVPSRTDVSLQSSLASQSLFLSILALVLYLCFSLLSSFVFLSSDICIRTEESRKSGIFFFFWFVNFPQSLSKSLYIETSYIFSSL